MDYNTKSGKPYDLVDNKITSSVQRSKSGNTHPYALENLENERDSPSKGITEKDIENHLINNDPSEGFETEVKRPESRELENGEIETLQLE